MAEVLEVTSRALSDLQAALDEIVVSASRLFSSERALVLRVWMGVGVAAGYATCGQVGFEGRYEYTAIGTVTNLAARLCSEAKGGQVLVSDRVMTMLDGAVVADHLGEIEFKGIARPVPTYVVQSLSG